LWLADNGCDPKMGARPMARLIQEEIKKPLANDLLFGKLANGGHVRIYVEGNKLNFAVESKALVVSENS
jgi:ATP-dependent Clp protease ATP-binding subunit ClpA